MTLKNLGPSNSRIVLTFILALFLGQGLSQPLSGNSIAGLRWEASQILSITPTRPLVHFSPLNIRPTVDPAGKFQMGSAGSAAIPADLAYRNLGFFCKLEVDIARGLSLPLKFRLGEVQYVERMEGKKGYWPY